MTKMRAILTAGMIAVALTGCTQAECDLTGAADSWAAFETCRDGYANQQN